MSGPPSTSDGYTRKPGPATGPDPRQVENSMPGNLARDMTQRQGNFPTAMNFSPVENPIWGNGTSYQPLPATYAYPNQQREDFAFKQQMMKDPTINKVEGGATVNYEMSDNDVAVVRDAENARRMYEYHAYLDKHWDLRIPGHLNYVMSIEPEYVQMKMTALQDKLKLEEKLTRLKAFGVQDQDDMRTKYLVDTGQINDNRPVTDKNRYVSGLFAPQYAVTDKPSNFTNINNNEKSWAFPGLGKGSMSEAATHAGTPAPAAARAAASTSGQPPPG